jgi:hypothetical protein
VKGTEVEDRLCQDAAYWNASRKPQPDLTAALQRVRDRTAPTRTGPRQRVTILSAAATVLVVAGIIGAVQLSHSQTGTSAAGDGTHALPACGRVPTSNGKVASRLMLTVQAPASGVAGTTIHPRVKVAARTGTVGGFDAGLPADVYIAQHRRIVGRYAGAIGGTGFGTTVTTQPVRIDALPLLLSGCPGGDIDYAHPDASRQPLPAGEYQIVATLASEGRQHWLLVSASATITIHH